MLLPPPAPDGRVYLTSAQAAELTGVKPPTVRSWEHKGYLQSAPGTNTRKLYAYDAVLAAARRAREAAIRTRQLASA
jgi:DNA-binding transcriptional MerR regulator